MRQIALTKNIRRLYDAYRELEFRDHDEGMGLIYGAPGYGKTTASCELFVKHRGLLLTAKPGWTQKALLKTLLIELGADDSKAGSNADMLDEATRLIAETARPVFVDEADFLFNDSRMLETLRIMHDVSGCPVVLIGMSSVSGKPGIDKRIKKFPQFADRISQWIEFFPADFSDLQLIAETVCPTIELSDELLRSLLSETKGNVRQVRVWLGRIQKFADHNQLKIVDLGQWQRCLQEIEERNKKLRAV